MKIAFVFPGQGSQAVGMMDGFAAHPVVKQTFEEASDALGEDLWAMVESGPQDSPYHLPVEPEAFGGSSQDQAGCLGPIPSLGQHRAIANNIDIAGSKAREDGPALLSWGRASDMFGEDARSPERVADS